MLIKKDSSGYGKEFYKNCGNDKILKYWLDNRIHGITIKCTYDYIEKWFTWKGKDHGLISCEKNI